MSCGSILNFENMLRAVSYEKGFQVVNGPTSGPLGRTPWSGRLVETLGQDSYLNGIAFGLAVSSFVDAGVIAGGKVRRFLLVIPVYSGFLIPLQQYTSPDFARLLRTL